MANNIQMTTGVSNQLKTERGNAVLIREPRIGIVKDTIDATRSGIIRVWIAGLQQSTNEEDSSCWIKVRYMTPFYGLTQNQSPGDTSGTFKNNPQSYGFWATPPDLGTQVVCVFINGFVDQGYYIGCIPKIETHNMVPAVAPGSSSVVPNGSEADSYGGADYLPVSEINTNNSGINDSPRFYNEPKPIHSYQSSIMFNQGVIRDRARGPITSSSYRETPSRVFGISTPGSEIYEGGYDKRTLPSAINSEQNSRKFKVVGRTGGHSFVMDDGDIQGQNQLIRLRTSAGHQITMSDDQQTLFVIHSNGQSWIELNSEGAIDVFATNSFNVRTTGDINLHSDQNFNIHCEQDLRIRANTIGIESVSGTTVRSGQDLKVSTVTNYELKAGGSMSQLSSGTSDLVSGGKNVIRGSTIHLNDQGPALTPQEVPENKPKNYPDTTFSSSKGWISSPGKLKSITSRVTSHYPMPTVEGSTGGVPVKSSPIEPQAAAPAATPAADQALASAPAQPPNPVSSAAASAASTVPLPSVPGVPKETMSALTAQQATTNAVKSAGELVAGGVIGAGLTSLSQLSTPAAAMLKPGSDVIAQRALQAGLSATQAITPNLLTAVGGTQTAQQLLTNTAGQAQAFARIAGQGAQQLAQSGTLGASSSPQQIGGLVMAAANQGVTAVQQALSGVGGAAASALGSIQSSLSTGKFAGALSDKISSGLGGVASALGGVAQGAISQLTGAGSIAQNAFKSIESSYGTLKAGQPNNLGGDSETGLPLSQELKTGYNLEQLEIEEGEARDLYYADPSPENKQFWDEARAKTKQAKQQVERDARSFLSGALGVPLVGGTSPQSNPLTSALNSQTLSAAANQVANSLPTTATSGLNALPGGLSSVMNTVTSSANQQVTGLAQNAIAAATTSGASSTGANGLIGGVTQQITGGLTKLGSSITNSPAAVSGSAAAIAGAAGALVKSASGAAGALLGKLGSLGNAPNALKSGAVATGTFNTEALVAKAGSLIGDPQIPTPSFAPGLPAALSQATQQITAVKDSYLELERAEREVKVLTLTLVDAEKKYRDDPDLPEILRLGQEQLAAAEQALALARQRYSTLVGSTNQTTVAQYDPYAGGA